MTYRAGIVGGGFMGVVHARAVRAAGGTVAAVAASSAAGSRRAGERLGSERVHDAAASLIGDPAVEVVHICTPNDSHRDLALQAIAAGKFVVCEKPLAVDVPAAEEMAQAAAASHRVATVPFVYRFYPTVREARARIHQGAVGRLFVIHGSYLQDWLARPGDDDWRVDAGRGGPSRAFADIGVHWCDLAEFVTGHRIVRLAARLLTAFPRRGRAVVGTEDAAVLLFETDAGAVGSAVISQVTHGRKNRLWISVDGAESSLSFDQELPETLWVGSRDSTTLISRGSEATSFVARHYDTVPPGHPQGYQDCFNAFVADSYAAFGGASPDGLPTFVDGLRAAHLTRAVLEADATGQWVEVTETR